MEQITQLDSLPLLPILSCAAFARINHLPVGVIEANCDRQHLPTIRIGKRRYINLEALRLIAVQKHEGTA
jgi:hypothetical protein